MGRAPELATLQAAIADARGGVGSVILVVGEAGIGKTRLVDEAIARSADGFTYVRGAASDDDPQWVLERPDQEIGGRLQQALTRAQIARLTGEPGEPLGSAQRTAPGRRRPATFETMLHELVAASHRAPLAWFLDDAQGIGDVGWDLLRHATQVLAGASIALFLAGRTDEPSRGQSLLLRVAALARERRVTVVHLRPLAAADATRLIRSAASRPRPEEQVSDAVRRSAGNPAFAIQLAGERDATTAVPPLARLLAQRRTNLLSRRGRDLVEAAAVIGVECELEELRELADVDALDEAASSGLLVLDVHRGTVAFPEPVLRDAVYDQTPIRRRRALHQQLARRADSLVDSRPELAIVAATHEEAAGEALSAIHGLEAAISAVEARGERPEPGLVLAAFDLTARHRRLAQLRPEMASRALRSLAFAGRWQELLRLAESTRDGVDGNSVWPDSELAALVGSALLASGRTEEARILVETELDRSKARDRPPAPQVVVLAAVLAVADGRWQACLDASSLVLETDAPLYQSLTRCFCVMAEFRLGGDRTRAVERYLEEAQRARQAGLTTAAGFADLNRGRLTGRLEDLADAEQQLPELGAWVVGLVRLTQAGLLMLRGHCRSGMATLQRVRVLLEPDMPILLPLLDGLEASGRLLLGDLDRARELIAPWDLRDPSLPLPARTALGAAAGWLAWEEDDLERCVDDLRQSLELEVVGGYGLLDLGSGSLPLLVDALLRLGRAREAESRVRRATNHGPDDAFSRAAQSAARFRLRPTRARAALARRVAVAAAWPSLEALISCWQGELLRDVTSALHGREVYAALGARRGIQRADACLRRLGVMQPAHRVEVRAHPLSSRELEIARLIASGLSNRQIGARLFLGEETVHTHLKHIFTKLGLASRAQLSAWLVTLPLQEESPEKGIAGG